MRVRMRMIRIQGSVPRGTLLNGVASGSTNESDSHLLSRAT